MTDKDTLMNLIDAYAETRHRCGGIYNAKTEAARKAVIEALSGVLSACTQPAIKPLEWSAESGPTDKIRYNHITAETALGQFSVEWKGWKEEDGPCVYLNGDYIGVASNLGGAKQLAERHIRELVANLLAASPTPPAEQQATKETSGGFHVWRDISTAPKDGSRFVAIGYNYGLYSEGRHICVAQWFRGCWMETSDWNEASELQHLTHWLPLPSPPDNAAELNDLDVSVSPQQAAPKAAPGVGDELRDTLVAVSAAIAERDDRAAQKMICEILAASTTPPAEQQAQPGAVYAELPQPDSWFHFTAQFWENKLRDFADRTHALRMQAAPKAVPGEPVHGDVLPPVGSRVYIRHGRDNGAHACTVTGYYAWGDLGGDKRLHRVFVRLVYEGTDTQQARMLCDCHPTAEAALSEAAPQQEAQEPVAVPRFNCWSTNEGDSWFDHPADSQAIYDCLGNDAKVGDEYELTAGWTSVTARYRITEVVGDGEEYEVECISHPHENSAPQPAPVVGRMSPSKEWLETRLAIADDSDVQAGVPSKNARPCDAPPGCDSHNCHGCDDFKHPSPTPQPAPAPLSDDTERLEWLLWKLPGDALRYVVGELSDTSSGAEFRAAIDAAIAAQGGKV